MKRSFASNLALWNLHIAVAEYRIARLFRDRFGMFMRIDGKACGPALRCGFGRKNLIL
ncbi:hypothetical protein [Erythrobacter insulae]|uniref:hypothetical protein n=1 Tax=Erythrobacter insulae TaxID=2584124 RepID=UPI00163DA3C2|nr:hypothetical protein [Erythrobacter insulae]